MAVTVKFGANTLEIEANGRTVGSVRSDYESPLGMSGEEQARLNNAGTAEADYVLRNGDVIEFVKPAGEKG